MKDNGQKNKETKKILIIGMAGGLAQILAKLILHKNPHWNIIGVDSRYITTDIASEGLTVKKIRYSRGQFENLFRDNEFDYVYHLGRFSHASHSQNNLTQRLDLSVMGTNRILDLSLRFNVKKIIILSTFHVYGALSDNSIFIKEDAPLRASIKYPELRDVVEMDQICSTWMWKYRDNVETVLLRPCNIVGNQVSNSISKYLKGNMPIRPIDYNPTFQFIHEFDMAQVLYEAIDSLPVGIYNVTPSEFIDLKSALSITSPARLPFPVSLASLFSKPLKMAGFQVPDYLIDYLKFSCLIDNTLLRKHLGDDFFRFKIEETLRLLKNN